MKGKNLRGILTAMLLAGLLLAGGSWALAGPGGPEPNAGSVKAADTFTIINGTYYTTTATKYGTTNLRYIYYNNLDVFVTIDLKTTGTVTVTPQYSADGTNYMDAAYTAEGWVLPQTTVLTNASGVTRTTTSTATFASGTATRVSASVPYRVILSADGTGAVRIPMVGKYMRPKIELSGGVTNGVTVTVIAIARNN